MTVLVKICGLTSAAAVDAAIAYGADMVGFIFYPPSPRHLEIEQAAALVAAVPSGVERVGVFVDPDDALLESVLKRVALDLLQLHGSETPERVRQIRSRHKLPVIKAIRVATAADVEQARAYDGIADWLMFDARDVGRLPGGNGVAFDWRLLAGARFKRPWLLSGGLNAGNVAEAIRQSGASAVDVSSGVEDAPGRKNPVLIKAFLAALRAAA